MLNSTPPPSLPPSVYRKSIKTLGKQAANVLLEKGYWLERGWQAPFLRLHGFKQEQEWYVLLPRVPTAKAEGVACRLCFPYYFKCLL